MDNLDTRSACRRSAANHRSPCLSFAVALGIELAACAVWADTSVTWAGGGGPFWTDSSNWGLVTPCYPNNGGCVQPDGPPEPRWHVTLVHVPFAGPFLNRDVVLTELVIREGALGGDADRHDLTVEENLIWIGGPSAHDLVGPGMLRSLGTLTIDGTGGGTGTSRDLVNDGSATLTGTLTVEAPGTLTNSAGATFALMGEGGIGSINFPRPTFTNSGLLQKVGSGLFTFGIFFNNASGGLVDVQSGTLRIVSDGGSGSGRFTVGSGSTLEFAMASGTYTLDGNSTVDGQGTVLLSRSTVDSSANWNVAGTTAVAGGSVNFLVPATTQTATLRGGRITGDLLIRGLLRWEDGAMAGPGTTFLDADADILIGGSGGGPTLEDRQFNLTSGHTINLLIDLGADDSTIDNPPGGTFMMGASLGRFSFGGLPVFNNDGNFIKVSPRTSVLRWVFVNTGLVDITDGELLVNASFTQSSGETRISGGRLGGDPIQIRGGQLTGSGQVNCPVSNDGTISPGSPSATGALVFNSTLTLGSTSVLAFNVGGRAQGTEYDFVSLPFFGLTLNGQVEIRFRNGFESSVTPADAFVVLQACCPLSGSFANAASGSDIPTADGLGRFTIYYGAGSLFPTNQVVITNFRP